jgi:D-3-phosphoglycerate dehydrogenase
MKVLVTCPPMLGRIDEFKDIFSSYNVELITPVVVQTLSEDELVELVPKVDGWIIGDDPATERVFEAGKNGRLKAAVKWGVGIDNVDLNACARFGIPISNTPRMFGDEVADLAVGYLVGLAREIYSINQEVRMGNWIKPSGMSITGKCVAIVGLGDIGQSLIRRLKGFNVDIIGYDPFTEYNASDLGISAINQFPKAIEKADFIILTCALTESSRFIINSDTISRMKDGVYLINVARGQLIKEQDLIDALKTGKIRAAALDVFEVEPLPRGSELRLFGQCIFGTHNGSNTVEGVRRTSLNAIKILLKNLNISE